MSLNLGFLLFLLVLAAAPYAVTKHLDRQNKKARR